MQNNSSNVSFSRVLVSIERYVVVETTDHSPRPIESHFAPYLIALTYFLQLSAYLNSYTMILRWPVWREKEGTVKETITNKRWIDSEKCITLSFRLLGCVKKYFDSRSSRNDTRWYRRYRPARIEYGWNSGCGFLLRSVVTRSTHTRTLEQTSCLSYSQLVDSREIRLEFLFV